MFLNKKFCLFLPSLSLLQLYEAVWLRLSLLVYMQVLSDPNLSTNLSHERWIRLKRFGSGDPELKAQLRRCENPGDGHIAGSVSNKGHYLARDGSFALLKGKDVGQHLAGMLRVGQCIDGGDL